MTRTNRPSKKNENNTRTHTSRSLAHSQFHTFIEMLLRAQNDTKMNQSLHGQGVVTNECYRCVRTYSRDVPLSSHLRQNKVIYKWCLTLESCTLKPNAKTEWDDGKKNWFFPSKDIYIFMINDKLSTCVRINGDARHQNRTIFIRFAFWLLASLSNGERQVYVYVRETKRGKCYFVT